jgi:hypothetical protein
VFRVHLLNSVMMLMVYLLNIGIEFTFNIPKNEVLCDYVVIPETFNEDINVELLLRYTISTN